MKILHGEDRIIFEFPRFIPRSNPWTDDYCGEYPMFTGLIIRNKNGWDEIGFANTIDMDYKGKADQVGDFVVMWHSSEEEFIKKCNELDIDIQIYDYTKQDN